MDVKGIPIHLIVVAMLLVSGCSGSNPAAAVSSSRAPDWVSVKPQDTGSTLFFVTSGTSMASPGDAARNAMVQAASQIATYIGALVNSTSVSRQGSSASGDFSEFSFEASIVGMPVVVRRVEQQGTWCTVASGRHECFVLVAYPVREYERAKREVDAAQAEYRRRQAESAARALSLFKLAQGDEHAGQFDKAMAALEQAIGIIDQFKIVIDVNDPMFTNSDILRRAAIDAVSRVSRNLTDSRLWVGVGVVVELDGTRDGQVEKKYFSTISGLLSRFSFKARAAGLTSEDATACLDGDADRVRSGSIGAGHLVVLELNSKFSSEIDKIYFARCSGRWALMESRTGRVLASGPVDGVKGGGVTREAALKEAVDKAWTASVAGGISGAIESLVR